MRTDWPARDLEHSGPLLIFLMDPQCGWCFGYFKTISEFSGLHGNRGTQLALRVVPGGLFVPGRATSTAFANEKRPIAKRIESAFGVKFSDDYFRNVLGSGWLDSDPPCRAIIAAELLDTNPLDFAGSLMNAAFQNGRNISDEAVLVELAAERGIERAKFADALRSELTLQQRDRAFQLAATVRSGFPSLFVQPAPREPLHRLGGGELSADDIRAALANHTRQPDGPVESAPDN